MIKKLISFIGIGMGLWTWNACQSKRYDVKDYLEAIRIYTAKHSEVYETLRDFSELGSRYTGDNQSIKTKKWLEEKLRKMNMIPMIQDFPVTMIVKQENKLQVYSDTLKENRLDIPCETFEGLLGNREASAFLTDTNDHQPSGKIMLWEIQNIHSITQDLEIIARKGVLGIICVYPFANSIITARLNPDNRIHCPVLCVSQEEAMNLKEYHNQKPKRKIWMFSRQSTKTVKSFNMSCLLKGDVDEKIQVFCHWDSWDLSPAVIENGTSVAIALEFIRYVQKLKLPLKKSIEVVFLGASEQQEQGWKIWNQKNTVANDFIFMKNILELEGLQLNTQQASKMQKIQKILLHDYDPSLTLSTKYTENKHVPPKAIQFKSRIPTHIAANIHSDTDNLDLVEESLLMRSAAIATMYIWALSHTS